MIFHQTILTLIGYGFCIYGTAQSQSSERLAGKGFQSNINFNDKNIFSDSTQRIKDTLPKKTALFDPSYQKINSNFLEAPVNSFIGKPLPGLKKNILYDADKIISKPIVLEQAEVSITAFPDMSYMRGNETYYFSNAEINSVWSLGGIPAIIGMGNQAALAMNNDYQNNFVFRFDKDVYLQQLKKRMGDKFNPASAISTLKDPVSLLKEQAQQILRNDLSQLGQSYRGLFDKEIQEITGDPSLLFSGSIQELKQRFLSDKLVAQVHDNEVLFSNLQQRMTRGEKVDQQDFDNLKTTALRLKGMQELLQKVQEHRAKWESSGLFKKIKQFELLKKDKISRLISNPSYIRKEAKQYLSLKGLQRLFLNINRLNIGRDALSLSPMSFSHFLQNGISTEFINKKGNPFMLVLGRQKDFSSILDYGFTDNLFSNNSQVKAARIGLGSGVISNSYISVSSFSQSMSNGFGLPFNTADFRKILVTTISNQLNIGQKGSIAIDLSRSATTYQDKGATGDSILKQGSNISRILSSNNLMANTALSINYSDELTESGLSYQFNFSKVANGYNNPGNTFLNGGSVEGGAQLRKSFLKNKLQLFFRGNIRNYKYNDELDKSWRNSYFVMDAKWRMRKGQYISLRYQPNRMVQVDGGTKTTMTAMKRLSAETSLYKKIGKSNYRNYMTLGYQENSYALSATENISNTSLQVNSSQNVTIGKNLLYGNLSYIHSANHSAFVYFNSSVNSDIGYSFPVLKKFMVSSGIVYSTVNNWYSQLGVRESISGELNDKFFVSLYIDARKNLSVTQQLWDSPVRADISIRYILKK
jgi:hypothetical protein